MSAKWEESVVLQILAKQKSKQENEMDKDLDIQSELVQIFMDLRPVVNEQGKEALIRIHQIITDLQKSNEILRNHLNIKQTLATYKIRKIGELRNNAYWIKEVPFCVHCMDNGKRNTLIRHLGDSINSGKCLGCLNIYEGVFK